MSETRAGTELEVANGALSHVGQPAIADLAEPVARARTLKQHFGSVRDAVLSEHEWNFAKSWERPALSPTAGLGTLTKRYPLSGDCLMVRFVEDENHNRLEEDEWEIEAASDLGQAKVLFTNIDAPIVCFTRREVLPAKWDALFVEVFQLRLAAAIAMPIARNAGLGADLTALADGKLRRARLADAREGARRAISRDTSWIKARRV